MNEFNDILNINIIESKIIYEELCLNLLDNNILHESKIDIKTYIKNFFKKLWEIIKEVFKRLINLINKIFGKGIHESYLIYSASEYERDIDNYEKKIKELSKRAEIIELGEIYTYNNGNILGKMEDDLKIVMTNSSNFIKQNCRELRQLIKKDAVPNDLKKFIDDTNNADVVLRYIRKYFSNDEDPSNGNITIKSIKNDKLEPTIITLTNKNVYTYLTQMKNTISNREMFMGTIREAFNIIKVDFEEMEITSKTMSEDSSNPDYIITNYCSYCSNSLTKLDSLVTNLIKISLEVRDNYINIIKRTNLIK